MFELMQGFSAIFANTMYTPGFGSLHPETFAELFWVLNQRNCPTAQNLAMQLCQPCDWRKFYTDLDFLFACTCVQTGRFCAAYGCTPENFGLAWEIALRVPAPEYATSRLLALDAVAVAIACSAACLPSLIADPSLANIAAWCAHAAPGSTGAEAWAQSVVATAAGVNATSTMQAVGQAIIANPTADSAVALLGASVASAFADQVHAAHNAEIAWVVINFLIDIGLCCFFLWKAKKLTEEVAVDAGASPESSALTAEPLPSAEVSSLTDTDSLLEVLVSAEAPTSAELLELLDFFFCFW